jgi:hypothetical protein
VKKIISLYQRNYDGDHLVRDEVVPGAEWVLAGEGVPTQKWDGTCVLIEDGKMFARYEVKKGKTPPTDFVPANDVDENTGKQQGWVPVGDGPEHQYHREAYDACRQSLVDGTYELIGPKVQGNPEGCYGHVLRPHGDVKLVMPFRTFDAIRDYLATHNIEGIVWWHDDGRMVKIKAKDFGIKRTDQPSPAHRSGASEGDA